MTEFELAQLVDMYLTHSTNASVNYATILSGYLVANYFVGRKLSSLQFWIMSTAYSIFILATVSQVFGNIDGANRVLEQLHELNGVLPVSEPNPILNYLMTIVMLAVFMASLLFAYSIRSQKDDDT